MAFKVRLEIDQNGEEEIIIKCRKIDEEILRLEAMLNAENSQTREIELHLGGNDYFISLDEILFFETDSSKTAAHTKNHMYYTDLKLYELEDTLPRNFMRISKSGIINMAAVTSLSKDITGSCEAYFANTAKKVYVSRSYYKPFREKITETRLKR